MRNIHIDVYIGLGLLLLSGFFYSVANGMPPDPAQFPKWILAILIAFSLAIGLFGVKETIACRREGRAVKKHFEKINEPTIVFVGICTYAALIDFLGFFTASSLASVFFMLLFGLRSYVRILLVLIGLNAFVYALFVWQLKISLPSGLLI